MLGFRGHGDCRGRGAMGDMRDQWDESGERAVEEHLAGTCDEATCPFCEYEEEIEK